LPFGFWRSGTARFLRRYCCASIPTWAETGARGGGTSRRRVPWRLGSDGRWLVSCPFPRLTDLSRLLIHQLPLHGNGLNVPTDLGRFRLRQNKRHGWSCAAALRAATRTERRNILQLVRDDTASSGTVHDVREISLIDAIQAKLLLFAGGQRNTVV
jgi:hypothetical protein